MTFVHLHNHSEFSLLDGATRLTDMVGRAKELGMPAVALTDHGVMYGAVEFYMAAKQAGIKPVIGCEVYVAPDSRHDRNPRKDDSPNHLVLLAKDQTGYRNLMRLVSQAYLEGYYYKPRVDDELLRRHNEGLVAMSACLVGRVPQLLLDGRRTEAREAAIELSEIFGPGNFFLELQDHGMPEQKQLNADLIRLAGELSLPLVATNDSHYLRREDAPAHDILLCIQTGNTLEDKKRLRFDTEEFYLKSEDEMRALFPQTPEAIDNTLVIADMCDLELELGGSHLPHYSVPDGQTLDSYLEQLCRERVPQRYPIDMWDQVGRSLDHELSVIKDMGFPGYFLIVWDFVRAAKEMGIAVGPGRGSAAGSVVAYLLGITNVEPLRYGLLFERFLNPSRKTMPDIDIDFDDERRSEIIEYVTKKYGDDHVAQIITFSTMKAKAATRDAGRVLGFPYGQVDKIAKLVREDTIQDSLDKVPELREVYQQDEAARKVLESARALEGLSRQDSIHAAGVVISKDEITAYAPIQRKGEAEVVTQYSMDSIKHIGLLKMDFLGLRTLTVLTGAIRIVQRTQGVTVDLDSLPLDDEKTYKLLGRADTIGVFQLESQGMRALIRELKPSCFEDLIALLALFRPGPLGSGMVKDFVDRKHGRKPIEYLHPLLEAVLKETYGVMVYQEQVMQAAGILSGFTMAEADTLRQAISKKQADVLEERKEQFIRGAETNGVPARRAGEIFDLILHFAGYGFNKSHSTAYAFLSYQTAYLKAHYPAELMAAVLSTVSDDKDKVVVYVNDCRRQNIKVLPPDVNESYRDFTVVGDKAVRFGLGAVRNVGEGVVSHIISIRGDSAFVSFEDFCRRVNLTTMNKRTIESLIKAGAFDSFGCSRKYLLDRYESVVDSSLREQRDREAGQFNLFELDAAAGPGPKAPSNGGAMLDVDEEMAKDELLAFEKEMLGLYVSDHPLIGKQALLEAGSDLPISGLSQKEDGSYHWIAGLITHIASKITQRGDRMYFLTLEDLEASVEVIVFSSVADKAGDALQEDRIVRVRGRVDHKDDEVKIIAHEIEEITGDYQPKVKILYINLDKSINLGFMRELKGILLRNKGESQVILDIAQNGNSQRLVLGDEFRVDLSDDLAAELLELVPSGSVKVLLAQGGDVGKKTDYL